MYKHFYIDEKSVSSNWTAAVELNWPACTLAWQPWDQAVRFGQLQVAIHPKHNYVHLMFRREIKLLTRARASWERWERLGPCKTNDDNHVKINVIECMATTETEEPVVVYAHQFLPIYSFGDLFNCKQLRAMLGRSRWHFYLSSWVYLWSWWLLADAFSPLILNRPNVVIWTRSTLFRGAYSHGGWLDRVYGWVTWHHGK